MPPKYTGPEIIWD